jgi:hypothetical protein
MTREHVLVLGLDEIRSIRWRCETCGSATTFALDQTVSLSQSCTVCGIPFVTRESFADYQRLAGLVNALKHARETLQTHRLGAVLQLEFNDMAMKDEKA